MRELAAGNLSYEPSIVSKEEALEYFTRKGEHLKVELIQEKAGERLSCYKLGDLVELLPWAAPVINLPDRPGQFPSPQHRRLLLERDEHNQQLQRIYGTAFLTPGALSEYLTQLEEAKKRDHRKLGRELDLFSVSEEAGPGLVFWHPKGTRGAPGDRRLSAERAVPARV